jgi:D-lactate dehydrogenase
VEDPAGLPVGRYEPFRAKEPVIWQGLLDLKARLVADASLAGRIRSKYRMKDTTGYSLNALLDFERPVEILRHLLVGSEGTLAFIAEAVLNTVPDLAVEYTGLLLFPDLYAACAAIVPLREAGAAALEEGARRATAGLARATGRVYSSFIFLVERVTRPPQGLY